MSARGRVALLQTFSRGELKASSRFYESLFSCILCEACGKSCPLGINIADAIYTGRKILRSFNKKRLLVNHLIGFALRNSVVSFKLLKVLRVLSNVPYAHRIPPLGFIKRLGIREADAPFRGKITVFRAQQTIGRIAIFTGCVINYISPSYGRSLLRILNTIGYDVILPTGEACCGAPMLESGMEENAERVAEINIETFKNLNVEAIIGLCPTCIHFIRNIYKRLVGNGLDNVLDVSEFFSQRLVSGGVKGRNLFSQELPVKSSLKAIYHDPCHSKYSLNLYNEPRNILKSAGINLLEPSETGCCGSGGAFGLFYGGLSEGILENRLEAYKAADAIITSCPNCIIQLKSRIKERRVMHIIEIIEKIFVKPKIGDRTENSL
jgi:glycolate oxidase iron-sulfur subunit